MIDLRIILSDEMYSPMITEHVPSPFSQRCEIFIEQNLLLELPPFGSFSQFGSIIFVDFFLNKIIYQLLLFMTSRFSYSCHLSSYRVLKSSLRAKLTYLGEIPPYSTTIFPPITSFRHMEGFPPNKLT